MKCHNFFHFDQVIAFNFAGKLEHFIHSLAILLIRLMIYIVSMTLLELFLLNIGSFRIYILTIGVVSNETNEDVRMYI